MGGMGTLYPPVRRAKPCSSRSLYSPPFESFDRGTAFQAQPFFPPQEVQGGAKTTLQHAFLLCLQGASGVLCRGCVRDCHGPL